MASKGLFSLGNFAKFSRTTRDILHHYDKIGLFPPALRGENHFRYYSSGQVSSINLLRTLLDLGLTLDEIKTLHDERTPESVDEVLIRQIEQFDKKIVDWVRTRQFLSTLQRFIHSTLRADEEGVTIQYLPQEAIILGDMNDYSGKRNDYDALTSFYRSINAKYSDLNLNYPVWGIFSEERIKRGDWKWPDRYYFYTPDGRDQRPAALYAIGYQRGGYGQTGELYKRLLEYIDAHNFEICGNAYEEYPQNEICVADDTNYLIRVMIAVRETCATL